MWGVSRAWFSKRKLQMPDKLYDRDMQVDMKFVRAHGTASSVRVAQETTYAF